MVITADVPEETWLGGLLTFGDGPEGAAIRLNRPDVRCVMVTLDPDSAASDPGVLKAVARRSRDVCAGGYGAVERVGTVRVGDPVYLADGTEKHGSTEGLMHQYSRRHLLAGAMGAAMTVARGAAAPKQAAANDVPPGPVARYIDSLAHRPQNGGDFTIGSSRGMQGSGVRQSASRTARTI